MRNISKRYSRKRRVFLLMVFLFFISALLWLMLFENQEKTQENIRAGICGAIVRPAVYDLPKGADLSFLIKKANGLRGNADLSKIDFEIIIKNDSIYHIAATGSKRYSFRGLKQKTDSLILTKSLKINYQHDALVDSLKIRKVNILYVGFPSVFILMSYYPDFGRISLTHIPHTSLFMYNDYRLIDILVTLGPDVTINILERALKQKIDFYMIQERFSFIEFINLIGGIEVNVDEPFALKYNLKPGINLLDGFHSWEFIRFIDLRELKHKSPNEWVKSDIINSDNYLEDNNAYEMMQTMRHHRQQMAMTGLRKAYQKIKKAQQGQIMRKIVTTFETNMTYDFAFELYSQIAGTEQYSFGTMPGYYTRINNKLYFIPNLPSFNQLKEQLIRKELAKGSNRKHITY